MLVGWLVLLAGALTAAKWSQASPKGVRDARDDLKMPRLMYGTAWKGERTTEHVAWALGVG